MLCWHHVVHMEDGPLFGNHQAVAQRKPNMNTVSDCWRQFPGTAEQIISAQTVKGNEETTPSLEQIGRGATRETSVLTASPASLRGAGTHCCPDTPVTRETAITATSFAWGACQGVAAASSLAHQQQPAPGTRYRGWGAKRDASPLRNPNNLLVL